MCASSEESAAPVRACQLPPGAPAPAPASAFPEHAPTRRLRGKDGAGPPHAPGDSAPGGGCPSAHRIAHRGPGARSGGVPHTIPALPRPVPFPSNSTRKRTGNQKIGTGFPGCLRPRISVPRARQKKSHDQVQNGFKFVLKGLFLGNIQFGGSWKFGEYCSSTKLMTL
jgi:hypothetical protein